MNAATRPSGRSPGQMRPIKFTRHYTKHSAGSVLVEFGDTKVLCTASVDEKVPSFLKGKERGWLTAEYSMLPGATNTRSQREAARGKQSGRTQEIQRLIGRSLRAGIDLAALGERTITLDCDVLQADGGTRTASITGAYVALADAINSMLKKGIITTNPLYGMIASISVGIHGGHAIVDLDYIEDSNAETDMNVVMNESKAFIEIQGTAEGHAFRLNELNEMLELAQNSISELIEKQKQALSE